MRSSPAGSPLRSGMIYRFNVLGILASLLCLCGSAGCAHYQLGTEGKLAFSTLYIEPVENKSLLPQARAILATQIREAFERDGRVQLVNSAESADATLQTTIRDYHRDVASVLENDTGLARKYTLTLGVVCTLKNNRTGTILFADRPIAADREAFTDGGSLHLSQLQSEYQVLPLLAEALARKVTHSVLDVW